MRRGRPPDHVQRYSELGNWLSECYGSSVVESTDFHQGGGGATGQRLSTTMTVPAGHEVDRIVLRENLTDGQLITAFKVSASTAGSRRHGAGGNGERGGGAAGSMWPTSTQVTVQGQSIGNKFIGLLDRVYGAGTALRFEVTASGPGASMISAALYNCSRAPQASGCSFQRDFAYKVVKSITLKTIEGATAAMCCAACRAIGDCAVFVLSAGKTCSVLSANQGGTSVHGAVSVSRPFPSWNRSILTEIYLCHACSCQEILRTETAGQGTPNR
jgi:hypothetical protein